MLNINQTIKVLVNTQFPNLDSEALDYLTYSIRANMLKFATYNKQTICEPDELLTTAYLALVEVKEKFTEQRGIKFENYAMFIVRKRMLDYVRKLARQYKLEFVSQISYFGEELNSYSMGLESKAYNDYITMQRTILIDNSFKEHIANAKSELERKALIYFQEGRSKKEICDKLDITRRELEKILLKLKNFLSSLFNGPSNI
ncbi:hypothetical protein SCHIN_v1c00340 [Spiroplasma chinense]|uniref:RNA polymerase sigma-70 region 2 domain-containing protein n=1 Tax=Spiroplasma chinense TaxID=216932 RepID=A0A5B9Y5C5_9MOLU|nr:sigma factor [Spiroplasma chinense]QEH61232.1 hypothetical protein SCHIN_v1c00340 [Spiroplasma chinense]